MNVHLLGSTGVFKSQLAAIVQAHFGAAFNHSNFPGSWNDTANALLDQAYMAKDMVMVVDDFKPVGTRGNHQQMIREADQLLRGNANGAGRHRLSSQGKLCPSKPPRTSILSTGEESFGVHSLQARICEVTVQHGDVDVNQLTEAQADASRGVYVRTLSGFLQWVAGQYDVIQQGVSDRSNKLRTRLENGGHRRTATLLASLLSGLYYFLEFSVKIEAVTKQDAEEHWQNSVACMQQLGCELTASLQKLKPTERFIESLKYAFATGKAHLITPTGGMPQESQRWGWGWHNGEIKPQGEMVGWIDGDDIYLLDASALKAARLVADLNGDSLACNTGMLCKQLCGEGLLATHDLEPRGTVKIRKQFQGNRHYVLHLAAATLMDHDTGAAEAA